MTRLVRLPRWLRASAARRVARPEPARAGAVERSACIYKLDRIGDFVLATGALRLLVDHFGPAECRMVVSEQSEPFIALEFPDVVRWTAPASASGLLSEMRAIRRRCARIWAGEKFTTLICLRHARTLYRDVTLSWIHAQNWRGLDPRPSSASLAMENMAITANRVATEPPWCGEIAAHRTVVTSVLGRVPEWREVRPRLRSVQPQPGSDIILCPFGSDPLRDYPVAAWQEAWAAAFERGVTVRALGPSSRRADLEQLAAVLTQAGAAVTVEVDLAAHDFLRAIARARLVLSVESAAAHIATAIDKPAVILLGGGHPDCFAPWGDEARQRWVRHRLECYGCDWNCRRPRVECLTDIPPAKVAQAIKEVLPRG